MLSAAEVSSVSDDGRNTWRHRIHWFDRPFEEAIVTKSSFSVAIVSTRNSRVKVEMSPIDSARTGITIDLKCSPTFSVSGT